MRDSLVPPGEKKQCLQNRRWRIWQSKLNYVKVTIEICSGSPPGTYSNEHRDGCSKGSNSCRIGSLSTDRGRIEDSSKMKNRTPERLKCIWDIYLSILWASNEHWPSERHLSINWAFKVHHMSIQWASNENLMIIIWASNEHLMSIQWASDEHPRSIQGASKEHPMSIQCASNAHPTCIQCASKEHYGNQMSIL